jgi:hypothetical protein
MLQASIRYSLLPKTRALSRRSKPCLFRFLRSLRFVACAVLFARGTCTNSCCICKGSQRVAFPVLQDRQGQPVRQAQLARRAIQVQPALRVTLDLLAPREIRVRQARKGRLDRPDLLGLRVLLVRQ